ncbi:MAG TPA: hypothetical protein VFO58_01630 [Vicinamibacterales bacterium]|nr:hypothetical protein [Vicinamibacterales bacterium]
MLTVPLLPADVLKRQTAKLRQPTTQVRDSKGNDARAPEGQHAILVTFVSQNQFQGTLAIGCGFEG